MIHYCLYRVLFSFLGVLVVFPAKNGHEAENIFDELPYPFVRSIKQQVFEN